MKKRSNGGAAGRADSRIRRSANKRQTSRRSVRRMHPAPLSNALRNDRCAYCGTHLTREGDCRPTREHLLPTSITGSRPYDFMACQTCGNSKSKRDELIAWIVKFGNVNVEALQRFDPKSVSPEGRKSLHAILRHFDLGSPSFATYRRENWVMLSSDWSIVDGLIEWTRWFARGLYFLETGQILKHKEAMRFPGRMILTELLLADNMVAMAGLGLDVGVVGRIFRPAANTLAWGPDRDVWLEWESIKMPHVASLCLGGKYALCATVAPYSKKKLLASVNRLIRFHPVPEVRNGFVSDLGKVGGKTCWILNTKAPSSANFRSSRTPWRPA